MRHPQSRLILLMWGLLTLGTIITLLVGVGIVFTGPRTAEFVLGQVYPVIGIGLLALAASIAVAIPVYQQGDEVLVGFSFAGRQRLSAVVAAAVGILVLALALLSSASSPG